MKEFFSLKKLQMGVGFAIGFMIYDIIVGAEINWIRAIVTAFIAIIIMGIMNRFKK